jgi:hypothetical protein
LWISAGNLADRDCREEGIDAAVEPWSEFVAVRNVYAHYTPDQIVAERVWHDTIADIARLRSAGGSHG